MATLAVQTRQSVARRREPASAETLAPRLNDIGFDATIGPAESEHNRPQAQSAVWGSPEGLPHNCSRPQHHRRIKQRQT